MSKRRDLMKHLGFATANALQHAQTNNPMSKTHYAGCDKGHEGQMHDEWGETACGLELEPQHLTEEIRWVTCENCLRVIRKYNKQQSTP